MADWEKQVAESKPRPKWVIVNPEVDADSTGGCKYLPMGDGSLLAQSYAPTKHTLELSVKTDVYADHGLSARAHDRRESTALRSGAGRSRGPRR